MKRLVFHGASVALFFCAVPLRATDYGIFVDGAYGRDQPEMNDLVDRRIDKAKGVFDGRHPPPGGNSSREDSKAGLKARINGINCQPGDTITLVMAGHGNRDSFSFSLASGAARTLTARELRDCLAPKNCCIRVVIFACHSGSFIDDLFELPNMYAVYTSCRSNESSSSDAAFLEGGGFEDNENDWIQGFAEDWEAVLAGADIGDELDQATESAWDKIQVGRAGQEHPCGWRSGEHQVRAHVEAAFGPTSNTARVHVYDPVFLRCQTQDIRIDRANAPVARRYTPCEWITFTARFGRPRENGEPRDPVVMGGSPADAPKPRETIVAHIEGRGRARRSIAIHTVEPNWLHCRRRELIVPEPLTVSDQLRVCSWVREDVTVDSPSGSLTAGSNIEPFDYVVPVVAHVESRQISSRRICIRIREPAFMRDLTTGGPIYVPVTAAQLQGLQNCDVVRMKLHTRAIGDGVYNGEEIVEVDQRRRFSATYDAGIDEIIAPGLDVIRGEPVIPTVEVRNTGGGFTFDGTVSIVVRDEAQFEVFNQTVDLLPMPVEGRRIITFPEWDPPGDGTYRATFKVELIGGDENPDNDELAQDIIVEGPPPQGEPYVFYSTQVGNPGQQPLFRVLEDTVAILQGAGNGLSDTGDQHSYAFQRMEGDFSVSCLLPLQGLPPNHQPGVVVRLDEHPVSPCVGVVGLGGNAYEVVARPQFGANLVRLPFTSTRPALWLGVRREGNEFIVERSADRVDWVVVHTMQFPQPMPHTMLAGVLAAAPVPFSMQFAFAGFGGPITPVPRPPLPIANGMSPSAIQVNWEDLSLTESGFIVERAVDGGDFQPLTIRPANTTSYVDNTLPSLTAAAYRIRAQSFYDHDYWSQPASAETRGPGIGAWALQEGIIDVHDDPLGDGTPAIYHYYTGAVTGTMRPFAVPFSPVDPDLPRIELFKAPGVFDVRAEWEMLDETGGWQTIYTLPPHARSGRHEFLAPATLFGRSLLRVKLTRLQ